MKSKPAVLCAGIIVADHVCHPVSHVPAAGELVMTDKMLLTIGGCAANAAVEYDGRQGQDCTMRRRSPASRASDAASAPMHSAKIAPVSRIRRCLYDPRRRLSIAAGGPYSGCLALGALTRPHTPERSGVSPPVPASTGGLTPRRSGENPPGADATGLADRIPRLPGQKRLKPPGEGRRLETRSPTRTTIPPCPNCSKAVLK